MVALVLIAKALTIVGPMLVFLISICDREDDKGAARYWAAKVRLWQAQRMREEAATRI